MSEFSSSIKKASGILFALCGWAAALWLLFPLLTVDSASEWNSQTYALRAILGIMILILLLGKTVFDLFFPLESSQKKSWIHTVLLVFISIVLTTGILYLAGRLIVLYFKAQNADFFF